ncbi:hypothetical protein [uncultured Sutterella sp.]|uniref:hypothetical protein n=1 Tax=uncultured Sutterella sp. TaxID=286133 RepID=UPI0025FEC099|nr:hypothetical protein [uncultured Sutterella sp.]
MTRGGTPGAAVAGSVATLLAANAQAKVKNPLPAAKVSAKRCVLVRSSSRYHNVGLP